MNDAEHTRATGENVTAKTCCFTGHRPQKLGYFSGSAQWMELKRNLRRLILYSITCCGVETFISGMAQGVDMCAAQIVLELKPHFPQIRLECAVPCRDQAVKWGLTEQIAYEDLLKRCDKVIVLQEAYSRGCMQRRNRYMVDRADLVIAVWDGSPGGTGNTVEYAQKSGKKILMCAPK